MGNALLVEFYNELPHPVARLDAAARGGARLRSALEAFKTKVQERYAEGTLLRLLESGDVDSQRAAALALGMLGTLAVSNEPLARMLRDPDALLRHLVADALWALWFRGTTRSHAQELRKLMRVGDCRKAIAGLTTLIKKAPDFAEAYNQRAIRHYRQGQYLESIADCERTLRLNPVHFGALSGMGHSYMKLMKPVAALKAFRRALELNPDLDGVEEAIHFLEEALGEEGRRDDKK